MRGAVWEGTLLRTSGELGLACAGLEATWGLKNDLACDGVPAAELGVAGVVGGWLDWVVLGRDGVEPGAFLVKNECRDVCLGCEEPLISEWS